MTTQLGVMFRREQDPFGLPEAARRAEELGFDQFWIVEDCFYMGGISQAAIALTATSTIKVGIGINPGVAHNAAILAMEYSTLARAFPDRLIGGLGHGVPEWMDQIGEKVASPLTAIEETTTAMKRLLNGERISVDGRYVKLRDVQLDPPPEVAPPILHGVMSPKSMQLAGRVGDGVLLVENSNPDYIRWARGLLDKDRAEPGYVGVYANAQVDDENPEKAIQAIRRLVADVNGGGLTVISEHLPYADELKQLTEEGGAEALFNSMPDDWVHDMAIAGSSDQARTTINRLADAGANSVILVPAKEWNWRQWLESAASVVG